MDFSRDGSSDLRLVIEFSPVFRYGWSTARKSVPEAEMIFDVHVLSNVSLLLHR